MPFGSFGRMGRGFGRLGHGGKKGPGFIPKTIVAGGGSYAWTGQDASLVIAALRSVAAGAGSYAWTGDAMTPIQDHFVTASGGSYAWTGQDATLTKSGSYTGPGDVVSGAYAWYGLRGYTAAYSTGSNPALDLVDQAGANPLTVNILANGRLDVASISAWVTANSVSTIKVKRAYDQSGNARHMNQATLASMPVLNLTGFGSLPAIQVTAASSQGMNTGGLTLAQPMTFSVVSLRNSSGSTTRELITFGSVYVFSEQNVIKLAAGSTTAGIAATDAAWHASQSIFNNASSAAYIDGSATTGLTTGTGGASGNSIQIGGVAVANYFDGRYAEWGVWGSAFNGTQAGDMNTNQHGSNGYNF